MLRYLLAALLWVNLAGPKGPALHADGDQREATSQPVRLLNINGEQVDPFASPPGARAIVFVFVSVDCPISNKYAPELRRLHDRFVSQGVVFRLIYPNPNESADTIRAHLNEYGYGGQALRDPRHELVKVTKAVVTPEAAVFDLSRRLLYLGRIDDRYVSVGLERPKALHRDLEDALVAALAGRPVKPAAAAAVGCFIADLVQ